MSDPHSPLAAASNLHATPRQLAELARDTDCQVRLRVAHHPWCPMGVLFVLARDGDVAVRVAAQLALSARTRGRG